MTILKLNQSKLEIKLDLFHIQRVLLRIATRMKFKNQEVKKVPNQYWKKLSTKLTSISKL